MTLPNFIVIGAEKCGTTALHSILGRHPRVFMSTPKEPSFFLSRDRRYLEQDLMGGWHVPLSHGQYEDLFAAAGNAIAIGESSPCYLYSPVAAEHIQATIPDVRIIALLRHPAERAFSQFNYNLQKGWEPLSQTFREALALEEERIQANSLWGLHYVRRGKYAAQLKPYLARFGDRVRVWTYDDFSREPAAVLREISSFLGIDEREFSDVGERRNVTMVPRTALVRNILNRKGHLVRLGRLLPAWARRPLKEWLRKWNSRPPDRDSETMARLTALFEEDIRELSATVLPSARRWLSNS